MTAIEYIETVVKLRDGLLVAGTTRIGFNNSEYLKLRKIIILDIRVKDKIPVFLRTCDNLDIFWNFLQPKFEHDKERKEYIINQFSSLYIFYETQTLSTAQTYTNEKLKIFDSEHINDYWEKSLLNIENDPEESISRAKSMLESIFLHILEKEGLEYQIEKDDLPKLYKRVADYLNLSPSKHTEIIFKQILGGLSSITQGIGSIRNKFGMDIAKLYHIKLNPGMHD